MDLLPGHLYNCVCRTAILMGYFSDALERVAMAVNSKISNPYFHNLLYFIVSISFHFE